MTPQRNLSYCKVFDSLFSQILKGRVGVCGKISMVLNLKGELSEYNRCICNLEKALDEHTVSSRVVAGKTVTNFNSDKYCLEVRNIERMH